MSMEKRKYGIIARRRVLSLATTATRFHQCLSNCSTEIERNALFAQPLIAICSISFTSLLQFDSPLILRSFTFNRPFCETHYTVHGCPCANRTA